jgi:hypothetical protein
LAGAWLTASQASVRLPTERLGRVSVASEDSGFEPAEALRGSIPDRKVDDLSTRSRAEVDQ